MSRAAKTTFVTTVVACGLTVLGVHYLQRSERAVINPPPSPTSIPGLMCSKKQMHEGVIRDEERSRMKRERQEDFDIQAKLKEEFLKEQNVRETTREADVK